MNRSTAIGGLALLGLVSVGGGVWWSTQQPEVPRYTVVRGDTLWAIAKAHDVTVDQIRGWNGLKGDRIDVGQDLVVGEGAPASARDVSAPATGATSGKKRRRVRASGGKVQPPEAAPSSADWQLPPEDACLAGPDPEALDGDGDEAAFAASAGLSHGAVKGAMDAALPGLSRCLTPGEPVAGTLELEITVACTGRVAEVLVVDSGGLPGELVGCIRQGVCYADFPAHDMPDGYTFGYPMTLSP